MIRIIIEGCECSEKCIYLTLPKSDIKIDKEHRPSLLKDPVKDTSSGSAGQKLSISTVVSGGQVSKNNVKKAGVILKNTSYETPKYVLVQTYFEYFGYPKGSRLKDENVKDCALRELKEETNITLSPDELKEYIISKKTSVLYYLVDIQKDIKEFEADISFQNYEEFDVSGICIISKGCFKHLKKYGKFNMDLYSLRF